MEDLYRSQFRLPYSLYERLKASADAEGRSVNSELVSRLEASFTDARQGESETVAVLSKSLAREQQRSESFELLLRVLAAWSSAALNAIPDRILNRANQPALKKMIEVSDIISAEGEIDGPRYGQIYEALSELGRIINLDLSALAPKDGVP